MNVEPLRKILSLECQKEYNDLAVIGGLDKFLRNWSGQAIGSISNPELLGRFRELSLSSPTYASLDRKQREDWVTKVLDFLNTLENSESNSTEVKSTPVIRKRTPRAKKHSSIVNTSIDAPISVVNGMTASVTGKFHKLGVHTVRDLLYYFPRRHLDYSQRKLISQLEIGIEQTIIANVWQSQIVVLGGRRSTETVVGDETGNIRVVWFNNPYLVKTLTTNKRVVISGKVNLFNNQKVFESPEWELVEDKELVHTGRMVPIYPLTQGLRSRQVRKLMKGVVDHYSPQVEDFLPEEVRQGCNLLELSQAIEQAHYPEDDNMKSYARMRLAYDELFLLQLGVLSKKREWQESQPGVSVVSETALLKKFVASLPFQLTSAQRKVSREVLNDLKGSHPMSRLLQGEVGSGKTIVATMALLTAAAGGYQGAFMAPTEILAEQHFNSICKLLSVVADYEGDSYLRSFTGLLDRPLTVALLIGDVKQGKKQELQERITTGEIDILIGTHALIQEGVDFKNLVLAVVDEQHRFGVEQRSALRQKGINPHVLVMTATPIPRTLALTLYGDLDLSVIDELPPGRQVIKTKWLKPEQRKSAYAFLQRQVTEGRQAFIICPFVEESEVIEAKAAIAEYERLSRDIFPDLKLGLLHGRMSSQEKDKTMQNFHAGELDILVSTPVVEVGIDVPNATVMLVESADRFGLSQLHQFRGRVGRGTEQSYCMLIAQNPTDIGKERLSLIERTYDGFVLAEEDLKLRGPGEFFGTRQSGLPDLRMARLSDVALLELARNEAIKLFEKDPDLKQPDHQLLEKEMSRVWRQGGEWS